ncbi:PSP1 C-terminal conserved region-domain-containing protein [Fennellomyces sp. T-0311]|nr:PSP1 C-terminal conserved region-domain-containing protein [Fennellomyces sp. T-0311]
MMAQAWNSQGDEEEDKAWKVVGSPARRGSMASQEEVASDRRRSHSSSDHNSSWKSFGAFQWDGPSIFTDPEPAYRQQRSLSFSMGQDLGNFGYDEYAAVEEDQLESQMSGMRIRSQSSGASSSAGPLTPGWHPRAPAYTRRRSEQQHEDYFHRFPPLFSPEPRFSDLFHQRRASQPYVFPDPAQVDMSYPHLFHQQHRRNSLSSTSSFPAQPPPTPISLDTSPFTLDPKPPVFSSPLPSPSVPLSPPSVGSYVPPPYLEQVPEEQPAKDVEPIATPAPDEGPASPAEKAAEKAVDTQEGSKLYMVEFKAGRTDFFYISDPKVRPRVGDLVIVEADRGKDLGKVAMDNLSSEQVTLLQSQKSSNESEASTDAVPQPSNSTSSLTNDSSIKQICRLAKPDEVNQLLVKKQDEQSALQVCQQKIKQRKLRMDVVDAEYQWDRRKLTFYFIAERRIDFRELVRELFKVYKTRIWMCAVNPQTNKQSSNSSS